MVVKQIVTSKEIDSHKLYDEIVASGAVDNYQGYSRYKGKLDILGDALLNDTLLDSIINDHVVYTLNELKSNKNKEIDTRTQELISLGFTYDNKQFSLSQPAQKNWLGMKVMQDVMTWPVSVTTIDDDSYSLAEANVDAFIGTAQYTVESYLTSGRALKISVNVCTSENEINSVTDTR